MPLSFIPDIFKRQKTAMIIDAVKLVFRAGSLAAGILYKDIFLALASAVPDPAGHQPLVSNPYQTWHAINPRLPDIPIRVLGPSPTSGTRDAFLRLAMKGGADQMITNGDLKTGLPRQHFPLCTIREDGAYIEEGENDALIVHKLEKHIDSLGIFGFSFLIGNETRLQGSLIDGVAPTATDIASGRYALSRPLFIYVKRAHVDHIPGIREFLELFTSERMWGPQGMLPASGLVPMTDPERSHYRDIARRLPPLVMQ
jgi:phosphate transport system substrate-binding protein